MNDSVKTSLKRTLVGRVVSNKMDKTIAVQIDRAHAHPLYKKVTRRSKKFYADDPKNECQIGDLVRIRTANRRRSLHLWCSARCSA